MSNNPFKPTWYKKDKFGSWNLVPEHERGAKQGWKRAVCSQCGKRMMISELRIHNFWEHWTIKELETFFATRPDHPNINMDAVLRFRGIKK